MPRQQQTDRDEPDLYPLVPFFMIGAQLGITRRQASRIYENAMRKLQRALTRADIDLSSPRTRQLVIITLCELLHERARRRGERT